MEIKEAQVVDDVEVKMEWVEGGDGDDRAEEEVEELEVVLRMR